MINFDLPNTPETYVHRIGRTARAGATGESVSFVSEEERAYLRDIERLIGREIPVHGANPASGQRRSPKGRTENMPLGPGRVNRANSKPAPKRGGQKFRPGNRFEGQREARAESPGGGAKHRSASPRPARRVERETSEREYREDHRAAPSREAGRRPIRSGSDRNSHSGLGRGGDSPNRSAQRPSAARGKASFGSKPGPRPQAKRTSTGDRQESRGSRDSRPARERRETGYPREARGTGGNRNTRDNVEHREPRERREARETPVRRETRPATGSGKKPVGRQSYSPSRPKLGASDRSRQSNDRRHSDDYSNRSGGEEASPKPRRRLKPLKRITDPRRSPRDPE